MLSTLQVTQLRGESKDLNSGSASVCLPPRSSLQTHHESHVTSTPRIRARHGSGPVRQRGTQTSVRLCESTPPGLSKVILVRAAHRAASLMQPRGVLLTEQRGSPETGKASPLRCHLPGPSGRPPNPGCCLGLAIQLALDPQAPGAGSWRARCRLRGVVCGRLGAWCGARSEWCETP